jgi:hypothetical protein
MMMLSVLLYHKTACKASGKGPNAGFRDIYPALRRGGPANSSGKCSGYLDKGKDKVHKGSQRPGFLLSTIRPNQEKLLISNDKQHLTVYFPFDISMDIR